MTGQLKLSRVRKLSPTGTYQEAWRTRPPRWLPSTPNSFGLPAGTSCPGKTPFCIDCYAKRSERSENVGELVDHNLRLLLEAGTVERMAELLGEMIGRYRVAAARRRVPENRMMFRIHWDGDFYSLDYAEAWARVIHQNRDLRFWAYTRSFVPPVDVIPTLYGISNLTLYLSVDAHNRDAAAVQLERWPRLLAAFSAVDYRTGRALLEGRRPIVCPENAERMPLMDGGVGACVTCRVCPDARRDIIFSTSHQEDATAVVIRPRLELTPGVKRGYGCRGPGCHNLILPAKRGRPRVFCHEQCRWNDYHLRRRAAS